MKPVLVALALAACAAPAATAIAQHRIGELLATAGAQIGPNGSGGIPAERPATLEGAFVWTTDSARFTLDRGSLLIERQTREERHASTPPADGDAALAREYWIEVRAPLEEIDADLTVVARAADRLDDDGAPAEPVLLHVVELVCADGAQCIQIEGAAFRFLAQGGTRSASFSEERSVYPLEATDPSRAQALADALAEVIRAAQ